MDLWLVGVEHGRRLVEPLTISSWLFTTINNKQLRTACARKEGTKGLALRPHGLVSDFLRENELRRLSQTEMLVNEGDRLTIFESPA
jgi:hypothetical protein